MLSAALGEYTIKLVQVCVKVKYVYSDPFPDIDILWQHDDGLKVSIDESRVGERTAKV